MSQHTPLDDAIAQGAHQRGTEETAVEVSEARTTAQDPDLDPLQIEAKMAAVILECQQFRTAGGNEEDAKAVIRQLLLLQGSKGRKLVFTRFDIKQIFAIWTRKLEGRERV